MYKYLEITSKEAMNFILPRHYSGRKVGVKFAFGCFNQNQELKAVVTFGIPASPSLTKSICGEEYKDKVVELNRLCRDSDFDEPLSKLVSFALRKLKQHNLIIVSFADTSMNHHGYIYQATNFIYTGITEKRRDRVVNGLKHARHCNFDNSNSTYMQIRSQKHRYVYFCGNKNFIKKAKNAMNFEILPYPKGENKNYNLGFVLLPEIVRRDNKSLTEDDYENIKKLRGA